MAQPDRCPAAAPSAPPASAPAACSAWARRPGPGRSRPRPGDPTGLPAADDRARRPGDARRHHRPGPPRPAPRHRPGDGARTRRPARPRCPTADPAARSSSSARSPAAAWAPSSRAATPTSAATWPSRSCSSDHRDTPELVRRFIEEAQIAGQLQHPGVVPVYELGAFADRRPYFTMKLVKGRTLADLLAARPDPADDRPRLLAHLPPGLPDGGLRPRPRRDPPRPEALERDGGQLRRGAGDGLGPGQGPAPGRRRSTTPRPARPTPGDGHRHGPERLGRPDLSQAGCVMGTPAYMAPEQARGEIDRVDERADVFALGSILCEVLTGQPAFTGRSPGEIQRKAARGDLADAFARLDACGADAELLAWPATAWPPSAEDRPRDAGGVAARLSVVPGAACRSGSAPPSWPAPPSRPAPRKPAHRRGAELAAPSGPRRGAGPRRERSRRRRWPWRPRCWR